MTHCSLLVRHPLTASLLPRDLVEARRLFTHPLSRFFARSFTYDVVFALIGDDLMVRHCAFRDDADAGFVMRKRVSIARRRATESHGKRLPECVRVGECRYRE